MAEVKRSLILNFLKNGKASGCDDIPQKLGRKEEWFRPRSSTDALLNKFWNGEDILQDWKVGLLVKLPKKRDLCLCIKELERYDAPDSCPARFFVRSF